MAKYLYLMSLFLMCLPLYAEPDTIYTLHEPTAEEYLRALPIILQQAKEDYSTGDWSHSFRDFIVLTWTELTTQYGPRSQHPYALLAPLHSYYKDNYYASELSQDLFDAWLHENPINFDDWGTSQPLTFDNFVVNVTQHDFNDDGEHEWVLNIYHEDRFIWREVLTRTQNNDYMEIKTPLFMFDNSAAYWLPSAGFDEELIFQDLNQDGLPEWIVAVGGIGGGHQNHGFLFILQWEDGELVDLSASDPITYSAPAGGGQPPLFPYGTTVDIKDTDLNGTKEIRVRQEQADNWGCTWTQTRLYGWQKNQYALLSDSREYDQVKGCAWRAAETAMWEHDYQTAIIEYERAYTLPFTERILWNDDRTNQLWEYAQVRLALAYALTDQRSEVKRILENLEEIGIQSGVAQQMSDILWQKIELASPANICQAIYDLWFSYIDAPSEVWETDAMQYYSLIPTLALVGYTNEFEVYSPWPSLPAAEKAGCDITYYGQSLSETRYEQEHKGWYTSSYRPSMEMHLSYHPSVFVDSDRNLNQGRILANA